MAEFNIATRPIFNRDSKGQSLPTVSVEVEQGRIRFFAQILGETSDLHSDVAAARARGHPDLVAPPSFFMVIEALAAEELARMGHPSLLQFIGADMKRLLHGDEHYSYHGLIFAGDTVSFDTRVVDFHDRKGGMLEFVTLESRITHAERGVLISATRNLLHRLG